MQVLNKRNLQATFDAIGGLDEKALDAEVGKAIDMLYDELKGFIEGAICNKTANASFLFNSARLDYAFGNFKFLVGELYSRGGKR